MKFTELEKLALRHFVETYGDDAPGLAAQLSAARPVKRENTSGGFFTDLVIDRQAASSINCPSPLDGIGVRFDGMKEGLELLLFFKDGYANLLEGYAIAGESTSSVNLETASFSALSPIWPKRKDIND